MRWLRPSKPPVIEPVETTWSVAEGLITVIEVLEMTCSKLVYRFYSHLIKIVGKERSDDQKHSVYGRRESDDFISSFSINSV